MTHAAGHILAADAVQRQLQLVRLPEGWGGVGLVVLVMAMLYAVFFFYRHEQRAGASLRMRMSLAAIRGAVILLLVLVWLEPILATYIHRRIESATLLLVDGSASMGLRDAYPDPTEAMRISHVLASQTGADKSSPTRAELVERVLNNDNLLGKLASRNPVYMHQFGDTVSTIGQVKSDGQYQPATATQPTATQPSDADQTSTIITLPPPRGTATNIGKAIRQAIESQAGTPIAAVVVFSDGRFNQGEPVEVVARFARSKKISIHVVGVGDPAPPRNVAVRTIEAPPNVFVKDPFKVNVSLHAQGLDGTILAVELIERGEGAGEGVVVDTRRVSIPAGGNVEPVVFNRTIGQASQVRLTARIAPQEGETLLDDNQKEITVRALDNKMRVLLVAGSPSWEYRYLTRMLERDETVSLSCWLQSADEDAVRDGKVVIDKFPTDQQDLFQYDCVILMDPQPRDIDPAWTAHIEAMVSSYGCGLIYVAGRTNAQRFTHSPNTQSLLELLPVNFDTTEADLIINELGHFQTTAWPLIVPPEMLGHPVLAMTDQPSENAQLWSRLPGVYWHYPVRREKPVATVLLRHSNPRMRNLAGAHVLLATQFVGSGRTAYMGFDTTWRWRRLGDAYFNRFWIQLVRHMVEGKLMSGQKRGLIQLDRDSYALGDPVILDARLLDSRHMPLQRSGMEAAIQSEGRPTRMVPLEPQPNRPGWYRGRFVATDVGRCELRIELPGGDGAEPATIKSELIVSQPDIEFRQTELDRKALETLALESDGEYLHLDEAQRLVSLIPGKTTTIVLDGQPISLWDRWWTMAALVGLLGIEWALRKQARLL